MKKLFLPICYCLCLTQICNAQYNQEWFISYNREGALLPATVKKILSDENHLYVLATVQGIEMNDEDLALLKYSSMGTLVWERIYAIPGNLQDEAADMELDKAGNIYVAALSAPKDLKTAVDFCTIKYSSDGDELWVQRWGVYAHAEEICDIEVSNGIVFVSGKSVHTAGESTAEDYHSKIYNAQSGKEIWSHSWNGSGGDWRNYPADMTLDNENNLIVVGRSEHPNYDYGIIRYKWDTIYPKTADDTIKITLVFDWERWFNGEDNDHDAAMFVSTNSTGDIYITGESFTIAGKQDILTVKYDKFGNKKWDNRIDGPNNNKDIPIGLAIDSKENIIVCGNIQVVRSKKSSPNCYTTIKYSPEGDTLWSTGWRNASGTTTTMEVMALNKSDQIIIGGQTIVPPAEPYVQILNPDGTIAGEMRILNPTAPIFMGPLQTMHIDQKGNLYFAGLNTLDSGGPRMFLTKFQKL